MSVIVRTEELSKVTNILSQAIDTTVLATDDKKMAESVELISENGRFYLNITNGEYFVKLYLDDCTEEFHAVINALQFSKLISKITTETVEFKVDKNSLVVKGNGTYKFPLISDTTGNILTLTPITIDTIDTEVDFDKDIFTSINFYNGKELSKIQNKTNINPLQLLYYIDEEGAITLSDGACVNSFKINKSIKLLLNNKLVKLLKLFKDNTEPIHFQLGKSKDSIRVCFTGSNMTITSKLVSDDSMLKNFPAKNVRKKAFSEYPYTIKLNKNLFSQAIGRLLLFNNSVNQNIFNFNFTGEKLNISDSSLNNSESIYYDSATMKNINYSASIDIRDVSLTLDTCTSNDITLKFGDETAIVIERDNIINIIPEMN